MSNPADHVRHIRSRCEWQAVHHVPSHVLFDHMRPTVHYRENPPFILCIACQKKMVTGRHPDEAVSQAQRQYITGGTEAFGPRQPVFGALEGLAKSCVHPNVYGIHRNLNQGNEQGSICSTEHSGPGFELCDAGAPAPARPRHLNIVFHMIRTNCDRESKKCEGHKSAAKKLVESYRRRLSTLSRICRT